MRSFLKTPALLFPILLAVIVWTGSIAASAQDREARSDRPSQAQTVPDATSVQGSQTPAEQSATPPSQATPQQQANPSASTPSAHASGQGASIEDELQLTPDQKQKISAIVDDENRQIGAVRDDQKMTTDEKIQKVQEIRRTGAPKIKAILTPEQLQKLAVLQEKARQQQEGGSQAPTPQKQ
jgi:Spy/CpxP family protein refolding chaperone